MSDDPAGSATQQEARGTPYLSAALGWMAALLVGAAVAALTASRDRQNRAGLEQAAELSAVGDKEFFPTTGGPALAFEGDRLVVSEDVEELPESQMRVVGVAHGTNFKLYVPKERVGMSGYSGGPPWWVKTGPGQFLRLTR